MRMKFPGLMVTAMLVAPCCFGASAAVRMSGMADGDDGRALDLDGSLSLTDSWAIGAGAGSSESKLEGEEFSAKSFRVSTDVHIGSVFGNLALDRWKDSGQLRATTLRGGLGWLGGSGFALTALVVDRGLDITYTRTVLGVPRELEINLDGTGFGADISWLGTTWSAGARLVEYDYGRNVERIRAVREEAETQRFPRLQRLATSVATSAAGAPDRELAVMLTRQFERVSVSGDWQLQRDAITGDKTSTLGLTVGVELGSRFTLDTMAGVTDGGGAGSVPWGGLALTLRSRGSAAQGQ